MAIIVGLVLLAISIIGLTNANSMAMFVRSIEAANEVREEKLWSLGLLFFSLILIVIGIVLHKNG